MAAPGGGAVFAWEEDIVSTVPSSAGGVCTTDLGTPGYDAYAGNVATRVGAHRARGWTPRSEAELDVDALDRIVSNLILNACCYGEPPVLVSAAMEEGTLRITVQS